jgi:hypothetical protein
MKTTITFLFIFLSFLSFCQIKATIIDTKTQEKIPYVNIWVENENIGTSSNENGEFYFEKLEADKILVFSAIGYETLKINVNNISNNVKLIPTITSLNEVVLKAKKNENELVIGKFKKSKINTYLANGKTPSIYARFFEFKEAYLKNIFLKKIKLVTLNNLNHDAVFNIRLYNIGENGQPDGYLHDENILTYAKKGKKLTEINLTNLNIQFPEKGFFIAVEWIITDENKYEYNFIDETSLNKNKAYTYSPSIGTIPAETNENSWVYNNGKWNKTFNKNHISKDYQNKYLLLAMELTLTN